MSFVLDASLALSWCFEDERSEFADLALVEASIRGAVVPGLWAYEIANGPRSAQVRHRLSAVS